MADDRGTLAPRHSRAASHSVTPRAAAARSRCRTTWAAASFSSAGMKAFSNRRHAWSSARLLSKKNSSERSQQQYQGKTASDGRFLTHLATNRSAATRVLIICKNSFSHSRVGQYTPFCPLAGVTSRDHRPRMESMLKQHGTAE